MSGPLRKALYPIATRRYLGIAIHQSSARGGLVLPFMFLIGVTKHNFDHLSWLES
jgi:hypothetical protein